LIITGREKSAIVTSQCRRPLIEKTAIVNFICRCRWISTCRDHQPRSAGSSPFQFSEQLTFVCTVFSLIARFSFHNNFNVCR
jgi:hypothetical protein